ncbi:MAG: metal transporter substrate-binding protein [Solirubrobacterales bacterium]|nr:metal transporter substrate-binding protein [Solirubrobacterales bacterium]
MSSQANRRRLRDEFASPARASDMLAVRTANDDSTFLITLSGDLDLSNAAKLERVLREAADSGATEIVVDLSHLQFIDSTGVQLLILADRGAEAAGRRFSLLRGTNMVQRVFEVCGLSETFTFAN